MSAEVISLRGWRTLGFVHVWPDRDRIEHDLIPTCVCNPEMVEEPEHSRIMFIHHALDGRQT